MELTENHQDNQGDFSEDFLDDRQELMERVSPSNNTQPLGPQKSDGTLDQTGILDILVDDDEQYFVCPFCERMFTHQSRYEKHIHSHTSEPYQCQYCPRSFIDSHTLKSHIRIHNDSLYQCDKCHESYTTLFNLKHHSCKHPNESRYQCEYCPRSFAHLHHFRHHVRTHSTKRPYQCEYCKRSFIGISALKYHIHKHKIERPYQCGLCPESYAQAVQLEDHILTHFKKQYECQCCQKSFFSLNKYCKHICYIDQFSCPHCHQSFPDQSEVTEHVRTCPRRSPNRTPEINNRPRSPEPKPLESTDGNRNVDSNECNEVNVPTSNVAEDEINNFNGNKDGTARFVDIQLDNLNFAGSVNSLDIRFTMQPSANPTSSPPIIGLPQPLEQSLSSTQPDYLELHQKDYDEWNKSFSAFFPSSNTLPSQDPFQDLYII